MENGDVGEAQAKKLSHKQLLQRFSYCVYCGGVEQATSVDHMPPRMMFRGKFRPSGLEFPACDGCNQGTKHADLVASLLGRLYPDDATELGANDFRKILSAVKNNIPGLLEEMQIGRAGQKLARKKLSIDNEAGFLRVGGPLVTRYMKTFGAKLGLALHFECFRKAVPRGGGVSSIWYSNVQAAKGEIPPQLLAMFNERWTLKQGKIHVSDQFEYSWVTTVEEQHSLFYAVFRQSFAIASLTAHDPSEFIGRFSDRFPVFRPGDFRVPQAQSTAESAL